MLTKSRNNPLGFAKRTLKNLEFIDNAYRNHNSNPHVHVVTQIVNSMLGLIVFPCESQVYTHAESLFKKVGCDKLCGLGSNFQNWQVIEDTYDKKCDTLGRLIRHIRNAASHRRVHFSSDSKNPSCVTIEFYDSARNGKDEWKASIRADHLQSFCFDFIELLENEVS